MAAQQVAVDRKHMPGISEAESSMRLENERAELREAKRLQKEQAAEAQVKDQLRQEAQESVKDFAPPASQKEQFNQVTPFTPEEEKLLAPK
jgi:septal ring factor EnvC (AmiA/AmiB activator)